MPFRVICGVQPHGESLLSISFFVVYGDSDKAHYNGALFRPQNTPLFEIVSDCKEFITQNIEDFMYLLHPELPVISVSQFKV